MEMLNTFSCREGLFLTDFVKARNIFEEYLVARNACFDFMML